ncbi:aminotransferase class V-fold PLP-dependent enzyme [Zobellella maritima]|uniref:aminotransferase class V-fold PLP-dependent enzyme n=1 Tax=Zobellella maritima TaxID=2059725 RepID=UPI000E301A2B|nr:aminotransferase class V-fold PLP-dependent enzyme [Zobellella maritima]
MDIDKVRTDSPVCSSYAYFDTAAASAPTQDIVQKVTNYLDRTAAQGLYNPSFRKEVYGELEAIRVRTAAFINASADEVAFVKNATEGISIIAQGIDWKPGDEVILPSFENLSNLVPWLRLQETRGIKVITVEARESGLVMPEDIEKAITDKTRLISFSQLPNATGAVQPAQAICALAKQRGVQTLICAAQSLGLIPIDVQQLDCDYLVACGRKALRAIEGSGMLYVRKSLIESIEPCLVGWWNSAFDLNTQTLSLDSRARRFEAGCPVVPAILSLGAAVDYAEELGVAAIFERVRALTVFAIERLRSIPGFELYGPADISDRIGIIPFNIRGVDAGEIVAYLEANNIIIEAGHFMAHSIMNRYGIDKMARISLHYFNSEEEIERTANLIEQMV